MDLSFIFAFGSALSVAVNAGTIILSLDYEVPNSRIETKVWPLIKINPLQWNALSLQRLIPCWGSGDMVDGIVLGQASFLDLLRLRQG